MVKASLDHDISFQDFGDSRSLVLVSLDLNIQNAKDYVSPLRFLGLPFDISPTDYEQQIVKHRQQEIAKIAAALVDPKEDYTKGCSADAIEIKKEICASENGCLSGSEKQDLEQQIQISKLNRKAKAARIACVQEGAKP
jgi:hypothetical protein